MTCLAEHVIGARSYPSPADNEQEDNKDCREAEKEAQN